MAGLGPPTDEEFQRREEASEGAFDMALAGAGMVLLSIIFGIINFVTRGLIDHRQRQREELLEHDYQTASQGGAESRRLVEETKGQPDRYEKMLEAYRQYGTTKDSVWMGGFWAKIPNPIKQYIEGQYERHPEWFDGAETGWIS